MAANAIIEGCFEKSIFKRLENLVFNDCIVKNDKKDLSKNSSVNFDLIEKKVNGLQMQGTWPFNNFLV